MPESVPPNTGEQAEEGARLRGEVELLLIALLPILPLRGSHGNYRIADRIERTMSATIEEWSNAAHHFCEVQAALADPVPSLPAEGPRSQPSGEKIEDAARRLEVANPWREEGGPEGPQRDEVADFLRSLPAEGEGKPRAEEVVLWRYKDSAYTGPWQTGEPPQERFINKLEVATFTRLPGGKDG